MRRCTIALVLSASVAALPLLAAAPAQAAYPVPASPSFGSYAEPLARYVAPAVCAKGAQVGTLALRSLLIATYPTRPTISTYRACTGTTSSDDHQEGRALDWMMSAANAGDRALASTFFSWLFATDKYGNTYANARRLGVEYIIWNRQMWRAYNTAVGWQPYTGSVPHTDHIHISLSWDGAKKLTTWWNPSLSMQSPCDPATMHCNADGTVDVFVTPGRYVVAGRTWSTTCTRYSSTSTRCAASIWATTARWNGYRYVTSNEWVLNLITYTDRSPAAWDGNMLAVPGRHTSAGRLWNVSCSPWASAGPRTCTDWIWATKLVAVRTSSGWSYRSVSMWVLTSSVRLTSA
jgi:hypothetical protein